LVQQLLHHHLLLLLMLLILPLEMAQHARHHVLQTQAHAFATGLAQIRQADCYGVACICRNQ
jgi:fumarate reductase subunit D